MWLFILEALLALALLLFIVWWTMAPVHKREKRRGEHHQRKTSIGRMQPPADPPPH